ncbi:hypothetical protein BX666DRAFT_1870365 [Dichotomocladium elegans]|nr:hypothetical protein BX666DRAFT_1870365 [Dichotomocladium elegans]
MSLPTIPIIDFSDFATRSAEIAKQVFDACTTIGFFYVSNHGVSSAMIDDLFELSKKFYDLPVEEKTKAFNLGVFSKDRPYPSPLPNVFVKNLDLLKKFSESCHAAAMQILEALAIALEIPEKEGGRHWFTSRHAYDTPDSAETVRLLKYPRGSEKTYKDQVRSGAHTDYGTIALLFQKDIGGLEVQAGRTEWISAPILESTVLVNIGGMFEYWTNGLFKSTMHRVVFKPEHELHDRYSIACFLHPDNDVSLDPIPSPVVPIQRPAFTEISPEMVDKIKTSADYLQMRLDATYV